MTTATGIELAVLIPERGRPDLLESTLVAVEIALERLDVPSSIHVLVNGSGIDAYQALQARFTQVRWQHRRRPLGYHGAIAALLQQTQAPWVYLLNSDMRLEPDALAEVMRWRASDIFAVASQILPEDPSRRREETGWTVPVVGGDERLELHDLVAPDDAVRSHVYAGGGSSLFQREPLQRYVAESQAYAPFYFEDADWGMRAWADRLLVLHCPTSRGVHVRQATVGKYFSQATINRVFNRNLGYFRFRYGDLFSASRGEPGFHNRLRRLWWRRQPEHLQSRRTLLQSDIGRIARWLHCARYPTPQRRRPGRLQALLVSPFAVLPATHGGARRILELARASNDMIDWILLQDESATPADPATDDDHCFRQIHSIPQRPEAGSGLEQRWAAHAHAGMRDTLAWLLAVQAPDVLCFEHVECIGLIESLPPGTRFIWTLHDAGRDLPAVARSRVQASIDRAWALVVTVAEDLGFWSHPRQVAIENGARLEPVPGPIANAQPRDPELLLMVAPLRYTPNLQGVEEFLRHCWPALKRARPALRLRILAGRCEPGRCPLQPLPAGVELFSGHVDPAPHYAACTLTLNAQGEVEGSSIKVLEALAHGRMMISTISGARGHDHLHSLALRRADSIPAMAPVILELLDDPHGRAAGEACARDDVAPFSWSFRARQLLALLHDSSRSHAMSRQ